MIGSLPLSSIIQVTDRSAKSMAQGLGFEFHLFVLRRCRPWNRPEFGSFFFRKAKAESEL
jgi:hypothetical protein